VGSSPPPQPAKAVISINAAKIRQSLRHFMERHPPAYKVIDRIPQYSDYVKGIFSNIFVTKR
jgi:hypothetical protein